MRVVTTWKGHTGALAFRDSRALANWANVTRWVCVLAGVTHIVGHSIQNGIISKVVAHTRLYEMDV